MNTSGKRSTRPDLTRILVTACLGILLLAASACGGSALQPDEVLAANDRVRGQAAGPAGEIAAPNGEDTSVGNTPDDPSVPVPRPGEAPPAQAPTGTENDVPGRSSPPAKPAGNGVKAGACTGFKNGPGITDSTITIGNIADISGPVPGLFRGAQLATQAYVTYFNTTNPEGICGRKLVLKNYDSRTDASADQGSSQNACDQTFAGVGSLSVFDSGGAKAAQDCGYPDIRSAALTAERNACRSCFGVQATGGGEFTNPVYDFWIRRDKPSTQKAAFLYLNTGAAATNAKTQIAVGKKRGMKWVYTSPVDVADFNYGPYVQQMKGKGVEFVQFIGAYQQSIRLAQAMQAANYKPKVLMFDPSVYDPAFLETGGPGIEGAYMFITFQPLDSNQPEITLYRNWLAQSSPGAEPTFFGLFSWSAAKLFVEKAVELGGQLDRASLSTKLRAVDGWTGGGSHVPMAVGTKHVPTCARFMKIQGKKFVPFGGVEYLCTGRTSA